MSRGDAPHQIVAYDKYVADCVDPFVAAADKLGGGAAACGKVFKEAFSAQRDFLVMASKCKKPANYPADVMPKLAPIMAAMKVGRVGRHPPIPPSLPVPLLSDDTCDAT